MSWSHKTNHERRGKVWKKTGKKDMDNRLVKLIREWTAESIAPVRCRWHVETGVIFYCLQEALRTVKPARKDMPKGRRGTPAYLPLSECLHAACKCYTIILGVANVPCHGRCLSWGCLQRWLEQNCSGGPTGAKTFPSFQRWKVRGICLQRWMEWNSPCFPSWKARETRQLLEQSHLNHRCRSPGLSLPLSDIMTYDVMASNSMPRMPISPLHSGLPLDLANCLSDAI